MPRRYRPDPLATVNEPRWLVTHTMQHTVLSCQEIAAGADLHAVMREALATTAADGWRPESDSDWGFFFARRGANRIEVGLQYAPPGAPTYWPSIHGRTY
jgi:hypothetical protein